MQAGHVTFRSRTRHEHRSTSRAFLACVCGGMTFLLGCGEPMAIVSDGLVEPEPMCELTEPCASAEVEVIEEGANFSSVERIRTGYFVPSACPPAQVNTIRGRNDEMGRTVAYRLDADFDGDGIIDYRTRLERVYAGDEATSPLSTETSWSDNDGDGIDDIRYHYVYPTPDDVKETFTIYVDNGDDSVVDSVSVYESEQTTEPSTSTTTHTSTQRQDLDGDFVDDLVSVTVRVEVNGYTQSSTTTVTATDPSLNLTQTMTATYSFDVDIYETETDLLSDGTIDARVRSVTTRHADGSTEVLDENDDDADGVVDRTWSSRIGYLPTGALRISYSSDADGDGDPDQEQRYDSATGPDGFTLWEQAWFDDDGDAVFERIYTTHYDQNEITKREFSHETDGTISLAVYREDYCIAFPL